MPQMTGINTKRLSRAEPFGEPFDSLWNMSF